MLNTTRLTNAILSELGARGFLPDNLGNNSDVPWIRKFAEAISVAIVTEIQTNAEVAASGPHGHPDGTHSHPAGNVI